MKDILEMLAVAAEGKRREKLTPEQMRQERLDAFEHVLDMCQNGCGNAEHAPLENAAADMVRAFSHWDMLPEHVADAVIKAYVSQTMHSPAKDGTGPNVAALFDPDRIVLVTAIAGTVNRVLSEPVISTAPARTGRNGVPLVTGQYV